MQISLAVLVSCLALLLHMSEKPFSNKFDQLVQGMSLGTLLATCFVGLLVKVAATLVLPALASSFFWGGYLHLSFEVRGLFMSMSGDAGN